MSLLLPLVLAAVAALYVTVGPDAFLDPTPTPPPATASASPSPIPATATASPSPTASPTPSPTPTLRPTPPPTPTPSPSPEARELNYGVAVHLYEVNRGRVLDRAQEAGFGWVRQQIWWRYLEPYKGAYIWSDLDDIVEQANARGLRLLLSIVRSPGWAAGGGYGLPRNPDDLGDLLYAMASRYRGRVHAYEIWNEPNLAHENAGQVAAPERYVNLLHTAYQRIKEADPEAQVISAPLTPTGITRPWLSTDDIEYLRAMLAYSDGLFLEACDALGAHAAGSNNPPDSRWPERPGPGEWTTHSTFYFRHVEDIRGVLAEFGADKPIWITEFGWATANSTPGYGYGYDNSEAEQAAYIRRALQIVEREWPYVEAVFVWNLNFAVVRGNWHEQGAFGILYSNWAPRPSYEAVQEHLQWLTTPPPTARPEEQR